MNIIAYVGIGGPSSLKSAAEALGTALGVVLTEEKTGRYEECQAYCGDILGLHLALLGSPITNYNPRKQSSATLELQVTSIAGTGESVDISEHFVSLLSKGKTLSAFVLT